MFTLIMFVINCRDTNQTLGNTVNVSETHERETHVVQVVDVQVILGIIIGHSHVIH